MMLFLIDQKHRGFRGRLAKANAFDHSSQACTARATVWALPSHKKRPFFGFMPGMHVVRTKRFIIDKIYLACAR
jgi:hypothetical protein